MPTYTYECLECNHSFDEFQKMSDPYLESCPKCKGKVKRIIGAGAGIIYKGSGFYTTDYRSSSYQKKAKEDSSPCSSAGSSANCSSCPSKK